MEQYESCAMQSDLFVKDAVEVRSQRSECLLQTMHGRQTHARRLLDTQAEEYSQYRNDRGEGEKRQNSRQQVEQDVQRHLGLIRRYEPFYQMKEIHIICDNFRVRS